MGSSYGPWTCLYCGNPDGYIEQSRSGGRPVGEIRGCKACDYHAEINDEGGTLRIKNCVLRVQHHYPGPDKHSLYWRTDDGVDNFSSHLLCDEEDLLNMLTFLNGLIPRELVERYLYRQETGFNKP